MSAQKIKKTKVKPFYILVRYKEPKKEKTKQIHLNPKNVKRIYTGGKLGKCPGATPIMPGDKNWKRLEKKGTIGGFNNPHNGDVVCFEDDDGKWYCVGEDE